MMLLSRSLVLIALALAAGNAAAANPYAQMSNEELTTLTTTWDQLSQEERRALLTEVRLRMAQTERPIIQIKTERRYGRVIQNPDGSVVRIETREQLVQYRRAPDDDNEQRAFGVGFEQRIAELEGKQAEHDEVAPRESHAHEPGAAPVPLPIIRANTGRP
jgi:hypothetical protein